MGIKTLLPVLAPSTQQINIKDMKGTVVGIDASCWLHKGAFACAKELVLGLPTDSHVNFFMSCIDCLLRNDVTPVVVFDGPRTLPAKAAVAAERKRKRALAKLNAQTTTDPLKARTSYTAAVEITPAIVDRVIEALKEREVDYVVAPYEADAQLAFLSMNGAVQYIISEDSDLLVFGAKQVIYKWDKATGSGKLITQNNLHLSFKDFPDFSLEKFRMICILAGCDYLKSIFGIGPNMATAFVKALGDRNIFQEIYNLGAILGTGRQYKVPDGYPDGLKKAMNTFKHQTVLHPDEGYVPLRPYPPGVSAVDMDYAGLPLGDKPVFDLRKTWASEQMLNTTDQSDASFQYQDDSDEDRSSDSSQEPRHNLRSRPAQLATVIALGNTFKWTIPNFPVMSLTLLHATVSVDGHLKPAVFRASDHRVLLYPTPFDIFIRDSCMITVDDVEQLVVWSWDFISLPTTSSEDLLSQISHSTRSSTSVHNVSESDYMSDSDSESDFDDDVLDESDSDEDSFDPHELPFKVMGVTYRERYQQVLEDTFISMTQHNKTPKADLIPEPDNPYDPHAIAVRIYTDRGAERVGYIQRELTPYVHPVINTNRLADVKIGKIAFRTTWYHPGWYMKVLIKKLGKWEKVVALKSLKVK